MKSPVVWSPIADKREPDAETWEGGSGRGRAPGHHEATARSGGNVGYPIGLSQLVSATTRRSQPPRLKKLRYLGLDVHAVTIAVAWFDGTVRHPGIIRNRTQAVRKLPLGTCDRDLGKLPGTEKL